MFSFSSFSPLFRRLLLLPPLLRLLLNRLLPLLLRLLLHCTPFWISACSTTLLYTIRPLSIFIPIIFLKIISTLNLSKNNASVFGRYIMSVVTTEGLIMLLTTLRIFIYGLCSANILFTVVIYPVLCSISCRCYMETCQNG